jgi:membrane protein YqaA with SNARE-associated domain
MSAIGLYASCFFLSIVSALVPWINGEVLLLSLAALVRSPASLVALVLLASAGQMVGKCMLYWAGRGVAPLRSRRVGKTLSSWRDRFERSSSKPMGLVFVSSAVGIPPFYVITLLAGAFRLRFGRFIAVGACGRLVRFGVLVLIPQVAVHLAQYIRGIW